jgi:hypothetical protein
MALGVTGGSFYSPVALRGLGGGMLACEDRLIIPPGGFGLVGTHGFQPYWLGGEHLERVCRESEA